MVQVFRILKSMFLLCAQLCQQNAGRFEVPTCMEAGFLNIASQMLCSMRHLLTSRTAVRLDQSAHEYSMHPITSCFDIIARYAANRILSRLVWDTFLHSIICLWRGVCPLIGLVRHVRTFERRKDCTARLRQAGTLFQSILHGFFVWVLVGMSSNTCTYQVDNVTMDMVEIRII